MLFSSVIFLLYFFPVFILLYLFTPVNWKNYIALAGSLFFYAWGAPTFVFVLIGSVIIDFWLGHKIYAFKEKKIRKKLLVFGLVYNLGLLFFFKYANFFVENIQYFFTQAGWEKPAWVEIALPIGISFFTFQKISYLLDVYRREQQPLHRLEDYLLYIILFPQLIAGPIVRYKEIASQISDRKAQINESFLFAGMFRFIIGLSKKLLIANPLGEQVDLAFGGEMAGMGTMGAWIMAVSYGMQIYFDFSGYSDMAIGLGKMMGFRLPENFNHPYISQSITEFWKRWHITLSNWMRDYLYIPLGGNRIALGRTYLNLVLVFFLSGLWHGAAWTFVIWGLFHGFFLILERIFLKDLLLKAGRFTSVIFTFFIVTIAWVIFRADNLPASLNYLNLMFSFKPDTIWYSSYFITILSISLIICFLPIWSVMEGKMNAFYSHQRSLGDLVGKFSMASVLAFLCITEVVTTGFNPFIYFRF